MRAKHTFLLNTCASQKPGQQKLLLCRSSSHSVLEFFPRYVVSRSSTQNFIRILPRNVHQGKVLEAGTISTGKSFAWDLQVCHLHHVEKGRPFRPEGEFYQISFDGNLSLLTCITRALLIDFFEACCSWEGRAGPLFEFRAYSKLSQICPNREHAVVPNRDSTKCVLYSGLSRVSGHLSIAPHHDTSYQKAASMQQFHHQTRSSDIDLYIMYWNSLSFDICGTLYRHY